MKITALAAYSLCATLIVAGSGCKKNPYGPEHPVQYTQIDTANGATISGTIHYAKTPPQRVEIDMAQDPACSLDGNNLSEQYVVNHGGFANVFVYIKEGLGDKTYPITRTPVVIDQKGCRFVPHVSGAMVGQQVEFTNSDTTMHNVHITPTVAANEPVDISESPNGGPESRRFQAPELMMPLRCNNHPWMLGYVNVVSNPFFAVSGPDGHYTITGLPPGTYTLVADHELLGTESTTITVAAKQSATQDFTYGKGSSASR